MGVGDAEACRVSAQEACRGLTHGCFARSARSAPRARSYGGSGVEHGYFPAGLVCRHAGIAAGPAGARRLSVGIATSGERPGSKQPLRCGGCTGVFRGSTVPGWGGHPPGGGMKEGPYRGGMPLVPGSGWPGFRQPPRGPRRHPTRSSGKGAAAPEVRARPPGRPQRAAIPWAPLSGSPGASPRCVSPPSGPTANMPTVPVPALAV